MDVDSDLVDQHLLQQFSCMGTTDKDELIKQLQRLVGSNMNSETAHFFLDMNNWNLQAAVCSYFDFEAPFKLPSMILIRDDVLEEENHLPPSTKFTKVWRVQNSGEECWPSGCCLQFAGGDCLSHTDRVPVVSLPPAHTAKLAVEMTSPQKPGIYQAKWRMLTPSGSYFGDIIWVILTVQEETTTAALAHQLSHLNALGAPPSQFNDPSHIANPFGPPSQLFQEHQMQDGTNKMC